MERIRLEKEILRNQRQKLLNRTGNQKRMVLIIEIFAVFSKELILKERELFNK